MSGRYSGGTAALLIAFALGLAAPAGAVIDLVGSRTATFVWTPPAGVSTDDIGVYTVHVTTNDGEEQFWGVVPDPTVTIEGEFGDTIVLRVGCMGLREYLYQWCPFSLPSEPVRFVAQVDEPPPCTTPDDQCDGLDQDCDGVADDEYAATETTCGAGECSGNTGWLECVGGALYDTCDPLAGATPDDQCDGLDQDCDGAADDDYVATETTCGVEECSGNTGWLECVGGALYDTCDPLACSAPGAVLDFDGDGHSDLLLRNAVTGEAKIWELDGASVVGEHLLGEFPVTWSIVGDGDFDGDGFADLLWLDEATGDLLVSLNTRSPGIFAPPAIVAVEAGFRGSGDFDGDGRADLLLVKRSWAFADALAIWSMNGTELLGTTTLSSLVRRDRKNVGTGDYDGNGRADILWYDGSAATLSAWLLDGLGGFESIALKSLAPAGSLVVANAHRFVSGDFDGNGQADIVVQEKSSGSLEVCLLDSPDSQTGEISLVSTEEPLDAQPAAAQELVGSGYYDGDDFADLVLRDGRTGQLEIWFLEGSSVVDRVSVGNPGVDWFSAGVGSGIPLSHR